MKTRVPFSQEATYHVYNRGAGKQSIFMSSGDYARFQVLMYLCNDITPEVSPRNVFNKYGRASKSIRTILTEEKPKQNLVNILGYALMPNHFHFLIQQRIDDGIKTFMHRIGTAYSMYFNKKNDRTGVLFQGRFQAKHIDNDPYFLHIFSYVHLNPLDLFQENWKQKGLKSKKEAMKFLLEYPYASCGDYFSKEGQGRPERAILGSVQDNLWRDAVTSPAHLFTHLK